MMSGAAAAAEPRAIVWETLAPGMELSETRATRANRQGDSRITILRMDPELWELDVLAISQTGETSGHTARRWSRDHGLTAAINAGMFATDHKTHIGFQRAGGHVNNGRFNRYQSVAAFGRRTAAGPLFRIFDLDADGVGKDEILRDYSGVVQNLRLIKRPGENRWSQQEKEWSEAALGEDRAGRILFIFCRSPFSMHDLNLELLALDVDLVAAQHLEGGPEAQLYVAVGDREIERVGSYETLFLQNDSNQRAWKVPNILGVRSRASELQKVEPR